MNISIIIKKVHKMT